MCTSSIRQVGAPSCPGRLHKRPFTQAQYRTPHHARDGRYRVHRDGYHDILDARPEHRYQRQRKQKARERHDGIDYAHKDRIHSPVVARDQPYDLPGDRGYRHDAGAYQQRKPGAVDGPRVKVPSKAVGAEPVFSVWGREAVYDGQPQRIVSVNDRRKYGHDAHDAEDKQPDGHVRVSREQPQP